MSQGDGGPSPVEPEGLSLAILAELAQASEATPMSLPRLGKRLGVSASVLMRQLSVMGDATLGGVTGPGWVRVTRLEDRWVAALTEGGRQWWAQHPTMQAPLPPDPAP